MPRCFFAAAILIAVVDSFASAQSTATIADLLQDADRRAWLTDWYGALPAYSQAEKDALTRGDRRNAMYAKFGRLRGQMNTLPLADIAEQIATDLDSSLAKGDARLRLRGLTVKGDIDLEWDVLAAKHDWEQVRQLARELGDKGWENRANGDLGLIAFLMGNTGEAGTMVQQALQNATQSGDIGGQLRYMGAIANGILMAGNPQLAMGYADRALKLANEHQETGFPFVVYSTKVLTFLALNQLDEAERFAKAAMTEAQTDDRRIKQVELLMTLAQIAQRRNQADQALEFLKQAAATAAAGHVQRLLADAEAALADAYQARGELVLARRHALASVRATEASGSRFTLPVRLGVLANIYAAQGNVADADRVYDQATDIVEGIMMNVPSRDAQARLIGVMSDLYAGHFRLAAERLVNPVKAYDIIERARGRALADVLRTVPENGRLASDSDVAQVRAVSKLQLRLMRAQSASQRKQLLDELWDAEQRMRLRPTDPRITTPPGGARIAVQRVRQLLQLNEVILEYVLTEPRSYCLAISRDGVRLIPLPPRKRIEELADRFVNELRAGSPSWVDSASALHAAVIQPLASVLRNAERLIVVPDGKLHVVPFDTVLTANGIQGRVTTTAPSATVFALLRTRPRPTHLEPPSLLAIGGVPYDRMFSSGAVAIRATRSANDERGLYDASFPANLGVLATAQEEVRSVARTFGPTSVTMIGDQATESALKGQDLARFGIVHFAVHAVADPRFPERAALVLFADATAGDDGLLQPREIARLRLSNAVVVLSACDTSVGPTIGQEGVQNLARAFLLAGARSVVTTLWSVGDAISMALMSSFYENLTTGQDIGQALANAKSRVSARLGPRAVPTLSAFQVVGLGDHQVMTRSSPQTRVANAP